MNSSIRLLVFLWIGITSVTACVTGKKPVRKNVNIDKDIIKERYGPNQVDTPGAAVKTAPVPELNEKKRALISVLRQLWQKEIPFNTFSAKAKMHVEARSVKHEFTAHIRMAKDKLIWVNVTALSGVVNVARALVTPDSVFVINYLQKEVMKLPISDANKLFPVAVDFGTFQNLLIGNALRQTGKPADAGDFGGTLSLRVEDKDLIQDINYNKTDSTIRVLQMNSKTEGGPQGMMQYGNYEMTDSRLFAKSRVVNVNNGGEPYYLDMNFSNISFDQELDFPFSIPKNYTVK